MPDSRSLKIPKYRLHKPSGLAAVRIQGRDFYLGKHDSPQSHEAYKRIVAEWLANNRQVIPAQSGSDHSAADFRMNELFRAYWDHVTVYYVKDGHPTGEQHNILDAYRAVKELYGNLAVRDFGPRSLKAVRQYMIDCHLCRGVINARINRIRRMFKWAVENELVDARLLHALQAVAALKQGRSSARESEGVKPVPEPYVEAVLPFLSEPVRAMVQLQRLTGMRSGEVTIMRACDIDTSGRVWVYRPVSHKTQHHHIDRLIYLGPRAQEVLKPFLKTDVEAYLFSPADAENGRRIALHAARKTPLSQGNRPGTNRRRRPKWAPGRRYTTVSFFRAVRYACEKAFPPPERLGRCRNETISEWKKRLTDTQREELKEWRQAHFWHPHQLRHNAATRLRKEFGIEAARVVLEHRSAGITEIYAEIDHLRAADVMARVG